MFEPLVYGIVMLLADVIAIYLQLMLFYLAEVVALLLYCFRMDGDVFIIRLMFLPCWLML